MRIQHNIAALNSYRNLTGNNSAVSKNLEKLSSGYRINRAGDDAAGLAISEKMRAQITGLNTAQKNAQDGVSLVQTAEGAMTEVHSMLNRMVELADQSANGTYADEVDRENLQKEISSLKEEINRIADSTNFNGINLLDGSLATGKLPTFTGLDGLTSTKFAATGNKTELTAALGNQADVAKDKEYSLTFTYKDSTGAAKEKTITLKATDDKTLVDESGNEYMLATPGTAKETELSYAFAKILSADSEIGGQFTVTSNAGKLAFTSKVTGSAGGAKVLGIESELGGQKSTLAVTQTAGKDEKVEYNFAKMDANKVFTINGEKFVFSSVGSKFDSDVNVLEIATNNPTEDEVGQMVAMIQNKLGMGDDMISQDTTKITFSASAGNGGLTLQIGDTADKFNQMTVSVEDMHAKALGISDIDISTQAGAKAAVDKIKSAINSVSSTRGNLGAIQNRLEHTINNLSVSAENMTAAESRIRDVDMANEMMAYTKNNILVQSSQAMLAQANQLPQGVLQLLQ